MGALKSKKGTPPVGSKKGALCETKWCRNVKAKKTNGYLLSKCWKCRSRILKDRHLATYFFNALRNGARKRGVTFEITLAEFKAWCVETGFIERKGCQPDSWTVGRKDHSKGYSIPNIHPEPFSVNCHKGHYVPGYDLKQNHPRHEPIPPDVMACAVELDEHGNPDWT